MVTPMVGAPVSLGSPPGRVPARQTFYRPELDILRFVAFLMVFLTHTLGLFDSAMLAQALGSEALARIIRGLLAGGAYGVDVFFCLSSYLITTLLIKEHDTTGRVDVKAFYVRRILRIWPLYYFALLCVAPVLGIFAPEQRLAWSYFVPFLLLSGNWAIAAWEFPGAAITVLWSVAIEEQFYLTWPLVIRRWLHRLPQIAWGLIALSFVTRLLLALSHASRDAIFCNTFARLDPIAAGALVGYRLKGTTPRIPTRARALLLTAGILGIGACGLYGSGHSRWSLVTYPAASVASILLLLGTLGFDIPSTPGRVIRQLVFLGRISYGLYVFHGLALVAGIDIVQRAFGSPNPIFEAVAGLCITIVAAGVSYRFLESPLLKVKDRFTYVSSSPAGGRK